MPISATGAAGSNKMNVWRDNSGFSLVEVMIVVAIIGVMTSVVALSLPSGDEKPEHQLARTERALIALSRTSVMTGRIIGVRFDRGGFETLALSDDGWVTDNGTLKSDAMRWPTLELMSVSVDGLEIELPPDGDQPHLWFLPTGEYPGFELAFASGGWDARIAAEASGAVKVVTHD